MQHILLLSYRLDRDYSNCFLLWIFRRRDDYSFNMASKSKLSIELPAAFMVRFRARQVDPEASSGQVVKRRQLGAMMLVIARLSASLYVNVGMLWWRVFRQSADGQQEFDSVTAPNLRGAGAAFGHQYKAECSWNAPRPCCNASAVWGTF